MNLVDVVEHKTTSEDIGPGSFYWRRLTLDPQPAMYHRGMLAKGHDVRGILYDVLRKPAHRPGKNEGASTFRDRVLTAIAEDPARYYQRGVVSHLESEAEDAAWDTWQTAESIRLAKHANRWPRYTNSCWEYGRPCDYWDICSGQTTTDDRLKFEAVEPKIHLPILLSQSGMKTFRACPRRYQFRYELGLRPRGESDSLKTGKSIHSALEVWWKTGGDLEASIAALSHDDPFARAKQDAMMRGYHARWSGDTFEVIAVEDEFVIPLVNPETGSKSRTFELTGRVDAVARAKDVERKSA